MKKRQLFAFSLATGALLVARHSSAVGTRMFELDSQEEFAAGEAKGVAVGSDGAVRLSWGLSTTALPDATASFASLALSDGSVLVGTSPNGKVMKVAGGASTLFAETGALAVTSLVEWGGKVYAATIPDGKIFRVSQGKADLFAQLPETSHVWALAIEKGGAGLLAATGPDGKLFRVDAGGKSSILWKSDEPQLVSLHVTDSGDVLVGSSGKGILFRVTGPGKASVVYDFPGEEVKGIASTKNGTIYAIANEYGEVPEAPRRSSARAAASPASPAGRPKPGKGTLYKFDAQGRPEKLMNHGEFHYLSLTLGPDGRAYVGSGAEGRVYAVDDGHVTTLIADTDERQVSAIGFQNGKPYLASSDPATVHRLIDGASEAQWTSKALDAGMRARFGFVQWQATGGVDVLTRTGNTAVPDATWSSWSEPSQAPRIVSSPAGRFVQVRVQFRRDPNAVLHDLSIPFVTDNARPILTEVNAQPKTGPKESKEGIVSGGSDVTKHESSIKLTWKVDNVEGDTLRYRVSFRREGQSVSRDLLKDGEILSKAEYDWDTSALPDGKYRVRVEASDELSNTPEETQRHALESEPVILDNTGPIIKELSFQGRRLRVKVADSQSTIGRVEVAIDGRPEWRILSPKDGVFDTLEEAVETDLSSFVAPGPHIVAVRAFDVMGNVTVKETEGQ